MVSEVRNAPITDITSASTPGMMKALLSRSSLYQVRVSTLTAAGWTILAARCAASRFEFRRVTLHHRLGIADEHIGGVVVRAVDERLNLRPGGRRAGAAKNPTESQSPSWRGRRPAPGLTRDSRSRRAQRRKYSLAWKCFSRSWLCWLPSLVVHINGQPLEIEIDAVTEQQHQNRPA